MVALLQINSSMWSLPTMNVDHEFRTAKTPMGFPEIFVYA